MAYTINQETGKAVYTPDDRIKNQAQAQAQPQAKAAPVKNSFSSDDIGVRDVFNGFGLNNDDIGYDGTNVTYKGAYAITPTENVDGVTKTTAKGAIDGANTALKNSGSEDYIVDVTSYAAQNSRLPNLVKYNNGVVSLGSIPIENVVIIDGNSYAPKSAVEAAYKKFKEQTGYATAKEQTNEYLSNTKSQADYYVNKINNYAPFAYDPESDPAYQAYKAAYLRNGERAREDTLAANSARTGGYANSAAITAGNQAYYNYMDALNDRIPELMNNAYTRYKDGYDMLFKGLELYGTPYDRQKLAADANSADIDAMIKALEADYERDIDNRDFNYKKDADDWYRNNIYAPNSRLLWQEIELNDALRNYLIGIEEEKYKGMQLDNKATANKYGLRY